MTVHAEGPRTQEGSALADVAERLVVEFEDVVDGTVVRGVVVDCIRDLDGVHPGALPELVTRSARQRLSTVSTRAGLSPEPSLPTRVAVPSRRQDRDAVPEGGSR